MSELPATGPDLARLKELLAAVQASARTLLSDVPGRPRRVRLRVGDVLMELEWASPSPLPGAPSQDHAEQAAEPGEDAAGSAQRYIRAEMVGTFYHASEPGAKPFAVAGDLIEHGQQVGILEAMKLMTPVTSDQCGRVREVLVTDGEAVEFGQPLIAIEPDTAGPGAAGPGAAGPGTEE